jgi:hypothetical protein
MQRIAIDGIALSMIARQLSERGQAIQGASIVDLGPCGDDGLVQAIARFGQQGEASCTLGSDDLVDGAQRITESVGDMARLEQEHVALMDGLLRQAASSGTSMRGIGS